MEKPGYYAQEQRVPQEEKERHLPPLCSRRALLRSALGVGLGLYLSELSTLAQSDPKKARPQVGDLLVFSAGDRKGQPILEADLPLGGPPIVAYPLDPATQVIRDGSRLNRVLLLRLPSELLTEQTRALSVAGVVCYSAVCTHTGCDVSGWQTDTQHVVCPCHTSAFDPKDRARVVSGPAPKPLAILPLQRVDEKIAVAGPFSGRVGAQQQ